MRKGEYFTGNPDIDRYNVSLIRDGDKDGCLCGTTPEGITYKINLSHGKLRHRYWTPPDSQLIEEVKDYLRRSSVIDLYKNSQDKKHLQVLSIIVANWSQLIPLISPSINNKKKFQTFCYPEVEVQSERFKEGVASLDCVGIDANGLIFVSEVGTHRKNPQLRRYIDILRDTFPEIRTGIHGLTTYYEAKRNSIKISLHSLDHGHY